MKSTVKSLDLSGDWQIALDPTDCGIHENRSQKDFDLSGHLPGSLPELKIGDAPSVDSPWVGLIGRIQDCEWKKPKYAAYRVESDFKMPFFLQPPAVYAGAVWYRRDVEIPKVWNGQCIRLVLERPHWETRVWVDDIFVSTRDSLSVPHEHDLSGTLTPGTHRITVRVDNRMIVGVGINAHSVSDHTQGNWNGITGRMELVASDPVRIETARVFPDIATRSVRVEVRIGCMEAVQGGGGLAWSVEGPGIAACAGEVSASWNDEGGNCGFEIRLGDSAKLWDEFSPNLYSLKLKLGDEEHSLRFGLRDFRQQGTQFTINGRNVFLRGTLECCAFPLTGYPPADKASWRKIFEACRDHGLNHVRFHSWCPPEAAFDVADEMGFYLQAECAAWVNNGETLGDGAPVDSWLYEEGARIVSLYGNHPSFVMMAYGNEPGGERHPDYLKTWVSYWKEQDPRRLHTSGAGWPELPENDFQNMPQPRIQPWGAGLNSRINGQPPETVHDYREFVLERSVPVVSHEIGQWCVYPDFEEIKKYTGVMKARNFEIFQDFLTEAGMADQAHDFLLASGKLQVLAYKEEIEASLRTPGFGGFQLLGLNDFPGQGTALVGVLDAFWEPKPYLTAKEFRCFCSPVVPLARLSRRVFTPDEELAAEIEIAHYGPEDLEAARIQWDLVDEQGRLMHPSLQGTVVCDLRCGDLNPVTELRVPLREVPAPARMTLRVRIEDTPCENSWDLWLFPPDENPPEDRRIIRRLDEEAGHRLEQGETLWLQADPQSVATDAALGFSPIFWNTAWTRGQPPHTLGILCDPDHPALALFPTEMHSNWQWWYLVSKAATLELPKGIRPLVQVVPDWFEPKNLGLMFEVTVGKGRLLVTSIDFEAGGIVGQQMTRSLLAYLDNEPLVPEESEMTVDQIRNLFRKE
ncbi:MAG: sugar-binding domain-containing protein [Kiritimatiellia bacterium]